MIASKTITYKKEVKAYFANRFHATATPEEKDSSCELFWAEANKSRELLDFLQNCYPQLRFAIREGISKTEVFKQAVLQGKSVNSVEQLSLLEPENITCFLHQSYSIQVPVIVVGHAQDFVSIIQALAYRNEPVFIPNSTGAMLIKGVNNWAKIHDLKSKFLQYNKLQDWPAEFSRINKHKELYKDEIIILSNKPYSNVSAKKVNVDDKMWGDFSLNIRLEHEFAHLYTLKNYGGMALNLHDELLADYMGICKTVGSFQKHWMLHFMGLENYPSYRSGARLENYVPKEVMEKHGEAICQIMKTAIEQVAWFDQQIGEIRSLADQTARLNALCETNMLTIASEEGGRTLLAKYRDKLQ